MAKVDTGNEKKNNQQSKTTALILAGGRATRMNCEDKGLVLFRGKPMIEHMLDKLISNKIDEIIISANRNLEQYKKYGHKVVIDKDENYLGPLSGIVSGMNIAKNQKLLTMPCDMPLLPKEYFNSMLEHPNSEQNTLVAKTSDGLQPICMLVDTSTSSSIEEFLDSGKRSVGMWVKQQQHQVMDFSHLSTKFINLNSNDELKAAEQQVKLLGFVAYSGTGKTTLITKLLPLLKQEGIRVAVIKHAHHNFDIDIPGKDSYEIRHAGAEQVLVASRWRWALMQENSNPELEPKLDDLLGQLNLKELDLVIIEGFKHETFPKIELHRAELNKPLLYPDDKNIIGIASNTKLDTPKQITNFDLDEITTLKNFVAKLATKK